MYQFFVEPSQIQGNRIVITGSDVNHIKNVLRMKAGDEIAVSNGMDGKEYRCGIEAFTEDEIVCGLRFVKEDGVELPSKIYLFQGLPKADKMELIIQKAVELGAFEVIPVAASFLTSLAFPFFSSSRPDRLLTATAKVCVPEFPVISSIRDWNENTRVRPMAREERDPISIDTRIPRNRRRKSQGRREAIEARTPLSLSSSLREASFL